MKGKNILSLVNKHWQGDINALLRPYLAKEFNIVSDDHLIDFLLSTERDTYLIIQDKIVGKSYDLLHQLTILDDAQSLGLKVINLYTSMILEDKKTALSDIAQSLDLTEIIQPAPSAIDHPVKNELI